MISRETVSLPQRLAIASMCMISCACSAGEPENPAEALYEQAEALRVERRLDDALELYQEAVEADPEFAPAYLGMAHCYSSMGDVAEGEKNYLLAVALAPEDFMAQLNFAGFYYRNRNYDRALQVLQEAMGIAGEGEESELVSNLWQRVETAKVRATVRRGLLDRLTESPEDESTIARLAESYAREASDLLQGGNEREALEIVTEGMQTVPERAQAELYYVGAQAQQALGDATSGFEWLQKAIELDDTVPAYRLSHAGFLIGRGELDAALVELDAVIEMAPDSEEAEFARLRKADIERMQQGPGR